MSECQQFFICVTMCVYLESLEFDGTWT